MAILHRGPWQIPYKATNVLCSDGKRRTVKLHAEADTFFSIPGRVTVRGKTVTGHVWVDNEGEHRFSPDAWRKNATLLPDWSLTRSLTA